MSESQWEVQDSPFFNELPLKVSSRRGSQVNRLHADMHLDRDWEGVWDYVNSIRVGVWANFFLFKYPLGSDPCTEPQRGEQNQSYSFKKGCRQLRVSPSLCPIHVSSG